MSRICSRKSDESFVAGVGSDRSVEVASGVRDKLLRECERQGDADTSEVWVWRM